MSDSEPVVRAERLFHMTDAQFEQLVAEGIDALPEKIRALMHNVAIVVEDEMSDEVRAEYGYRANDVIFGFYEGIPRTERGVDYIALPDKITIFKNPVLARYSDEAQIRECVHNTVWHEVAHHFGYDDEWIHEEERRRGKEL